MSNKFSPKTTYLMGLGTGIGVISVIGFFILLGVMLKGGSLNIGDSEEKVVDPTPTAPTQPSDEDPTANIVVAPVTDSDHIKGNRKAKVSLIEYSDIECPFCKRFHPTAQQALGQYGDKINWVYRHFPLSSLHPDATTKAEATECVGELGDNDAFWEYLDLLFERNEGTGDLGDLAAEIGINRPDFEECMSSERHQQKVTDQYNGATQAGGRGTPYSIITDGETYIPISGAVPLANLTQAIDSLL